MAAKLETLRWFPLWTTLIGCNKSCADFLKLNHSVAWMFGATGQAFVMNMHEELCPSGPTAWRFDRMFGLLKSLGLDFRSVVGYKTDKDFQEKQRLAFEMVRSAINNGYPCYGWELKIPEYYVINGYDDTGYYFAGCDAMKGDGPKPWQDLGTSDIQVLQVVEVSKGQVSDDVKIIKDGLTYALDVSDNAQNYVFPKYKAGIQGYAKWIDALESDKANSWGAAYNSAVWHECRHYAVDFLNEAKMRLGTIHDLFDKAAGFYGIVRDELKIVSELFPFPPAPNHVKEPDRCTTAAEHLRQAKESEERGIQIIREIVSKL